MALLSRRASAGQTNGKSDLTGAVADLGVMVPLAAALVLVNHLDPAGVFIGAGVLVLASGLYFGIPFPVQPLKALTAVAVAQRLAPQVIHAAGLEIAACLLLLSAGGIADKVAKVFTRTIVRSLQVGVGVLLVVTALRMVVHPPTVFAGAPRAPWPLLLTGAAFAVVWWAARTQRYAGALIVLGAGAAFVLANAAPKLSAPALSLPTIGVPRPRDFAAAFILLVIPQLPLTFGNAVVAVTDVAGGYFGEDAQRVTPTSVCISCALGNIGSALIGGMPMCHGAGGLTAHVRLGARTRSMNVALGAAFLVLGLFFARQVPVILGLLPSWALAAFLAYAGLRHAGLVIDLRRTELVVACLAGAAGAWTGNLAVTLAIGVAFEGLRWTRRLLVSPAR